METIERSQYTDHQGMFQLLPENFRLPWIPQTPLTFQANKSNDDKRNSLFVVPNYLSTVFGNFGNMLPTFKSIVSDQSVISQNVSNENRLQNFQKPSSSNMRSRKKRRKKRNRSLRGFRPGVNDATTNSSHEQRQRGHQGWNRVPVFDWLQSNLPNTRPRGNNFQNSSRSGTFRNFGGNPRSEQPTSSEFTSPAAVSRIHFNSRNLSNHSRSLGKDASRSSPALNNKRLGAMEASANSAKSNRSNNNDDEDDITYLFSVDSSEKEMVLEIDIHSEAINLIPKKGSPEVHLIKGLQADDATTNKSKSVKRPDSRKRKLSAHGS